MYYKAVSDNKIWYLNLEINSGEYQSVPKWRSRKEAEVTLNKEGKVIEDSEESSLHIRYYNFGVWQTNYFFEKRASVF
jgi:hypothetical protein